MAKSDIQLQQDIEEELLGDPTVNAVQIGVSVDHGAVSLIGAVDTYAEKWAAEDAAKRVHGVHTVAHDLTVKVLTEHVRSDPEITAAVQQALQWNVYIPTTVTAQVNQGAVTLEGEVMWNFQRATAERAIRYLWGIVAIHNSITVRPHSSAIEVKEKVLAALQRQASADAKSIHVETSGGKVTLTGSAGSWQSIEDAANAAWAAPGVTHVIDRVKLSC